MDFNEPDVSVSGKWAFFDTNGNNFADTNEIRLYDSGGGYEVECASCHDPHGVPSGGQGSRFSPSFLRGSQAAMRVLQVVSAMVPAPCV